MADHLTLTTHEAAGGHADARSLRRNRLPNLHATEFIVGNRRTGKCNSQGSFSENETILLTDWMAHTPRDVLAKNFGISGKTLENLPREELFIFQADPPGPLAEHQRAAAGSLGITQYDFAFRANQPAVTKRTQGWRSADCRLHHLQSIDNRSRGHRDRPSGWAARTPLASQRG